MIGNFRIFRHLGFGKKCVKIKHSTTQDFQKMSREYEQDGPEAMRIASVIPYFPFHGGFFSKIPTRSILISFVGIDRFYDISGMIHDPEAFQLCINIFVERYRGLEIDFIAGLDARGFILGPPIALALRKPFVMIRKKGKLPNAVSGQEYFKEYKENQAAATGDELCISRSATTLGNHALVIDDLVATGVQSFIEYLVWNLKKCI